MHKMQKKYFFIFLVEIGDFDVFYVCSVSVNCNRKEVKLQWNKRVFLLHPLSLFSLE